MVEMRNVLCGVTADRTVRQEWDDDPRSRQLKPYYNEVAAAEPTAPEATPTAPVAIPTAPAATPTAPVSTTTALAETLPHLSRHPPHL